MLGTAQCSGYRTMTPAVFRLPPLRPWFNDASLCQGQCIIISCDLCHLTAMGFLITQAQRLKCTTNPCEPKVQTLHCSVSDSFFLLLGLCEVTERGCQQYGYLRHRTLPGVSDGQPIITKNRFLRPFSETWQPSRWADHLFQHHITTRSSTKRWDWLVDQCLRDYSNSSKQLKNSTLESCISNR